MTSEKLELILEQHDIHPAFWPEMKALVFDGTADVRRVEDPPEPRRQLQDCPDTILAELSKQAKDKFPPPLRHYESLEVPA